VPTNPGHTPGGICEAGHEANRGPPPPLVAGLLRTEAAVGHAGADGRCGRLPTSCEVLAPLQELLAVDLASGVATLERAPVV
jgi:hypothetical protein